MRSVLAFLLSATAVSAWEVSSDGPVCLLTHVTDDVVITVSHDQRRADPYVIELARADDGWVAAPMFFITFDGPKPRTISTGRHFLTEDGRSVRVADKGFGNVLAGMAQNFVAVAILGGKTVLIPLAGAPPMVAAFEDCVDATKV